MIKSIEISNFRCFRKLREKDCAPINVIVGENGAGKTSLMEAIFLALCTSPEKGALLRQYRGNDAVFAGNPAAIVEALYAEFFYRQDLTQTPHIRLNGTGEESRSLSIIRGRGDVRIPTGKSSAQAEILSPIIFEWTNAARKKFRAGVKVSAAGIQFENTGEDLGTKWYLYPSQGPVAARENADRFTALRRSGRADREFVRVFREVFDWIEDISVESTAGTPVLSATVKDSDTVLPVSAISGGINRVASILLAIAHSRKGIVLVDEVENGLFYTKHTPFCRALLRFAREYDCQLFLTSHSQEWLKAFIAAAGKDVSDVSLWRIEREAGGPHIQRFNGRTFSARRNTGIRRKPLRGSADIEMRESATGALPTLALEFHATGARR